MIDFILASGSPRRKELLELMGLEFKVIVSQADEDSVSKDLKPELYVQELALLKASATAKEVLRNKNAVIISADTIVTLDGQILGKPKDEDDAFNMLSKLSGREHEVYTGYCVMRISDGKAVCHRRQLAPAGQRRGESDRRLAERAIRRVGRAGGRHADGRGDDRGDSFARPV